MSTLLKTAFLSQGRRCLLQTNDVTSILYKLKFNNKELQAASSILLSRNYLQKAESKIIPKTVIYNGALTKQIKSIKIFSLMTSVAGLLGWPVMYLTDSYESAGVISSIIFISISIYSIITPLVLHIFTKRYVKSLEYDAYDDKYIATIYTLFCKEKQIEFKLNDVIRPDTARIFTTVKVKGIPIFFDLYTFIEPEHCKRIMAYDQPIDFKLSQEDIDSIEQINVKKSEEIRK